MNDLRRRLARVEIPDEHEARVRAWDVVRTAWEARDPAPVRRSLRPVLVAAVLALVAAAAFSSPGRAVLSSVREAVGVERAQPALFSLPAPGRVLVESDAGVWVVSADGARRLLAGYEDGAWSPFGRYIAATRFDELAALEPDGDVRWSLARHDVETPSWGGTRTDTRIAYLSTSGLRAVAGDGSGDRLVDARTLQPETPLAWKPGADHILAYADVLGRTKVVDAASRRVLWVARGPAPPTHIQWSRDGERLLVVSVRAVAVFRSDGKRVGLRRLRSSAASAAFAPRGHRFALVQRQGPANVATVTILDGDRLDAAPRRVFMGSGFFDAVTWSPNGRWLLVSWPTADQWVFVRIRPSRRIAAVAGITRQFGGHAFPSLAAWCCPAGA